MTISAVAGLLRAVAVLAAAAAPLHLAHAAVAECKPVLAGRLIEHHSELNARQAALQDWLDQARQIGPQYTRWQLAYNRQLSCERSSASAYQCRAVGMPCAIKQVPPPDMIPLQRGP